MKISKKILSVIMAVLMMTGCMTVAFAGATFSGEQSGDVTITDSDTVKDDAVFKGTVTNNIKPAITNLFKTLGTGTYEGTVINNGTISGGTFKGSVTNNGTIAGGTYNSTVTNNGTISGGTFNNVIVNNGGKVSLVSAFVLENGAYTVSGSPKVNGSVNLNQGAVTVASSNVITVPDGATLTISNTCTLNGEIYVEKGGKLVLNGSLGSGSSGQIHVKNGGTVSGSKVSEYETRIYREYKVTVESNVSLSEFSISVNAALYSEPLYIYSASNLSYIIDLSAAYTGCLSVNSVTLYNNRKSDSNKVESLTGITGTFSKSMPKNDVVIYVDCTVNHQKTTERTEPTCTAKGAVVERCTACNHIISSQVLDALGHSFGEWTRNTDSSSKMIKSRVCSRCNYVEKKYVEIKGYNTDSVTVDYKSTMTFHYNVSAPEGCKVYWKYNDGGMIAASESGYTVTKAESSFTITAIVVGSVNDTYTVKVNVKNGFFDKFVAFFRNIFNALPVYVDNVKQ